MITPYVTYIYVKHVAQWLECPTAISEVAGSNPGLGRFSQIWGTVGENRRKETADVLAISPQDSVDSWLINTPTLPGMQSTKRSYDRFIACMLPGRGVRVWVVYLTPKIER